MSEIWEKAVSDGKKWLNKVYTERSEERTEEDRKCAAHTVADKCLQRGSFYFYVTRAQSGDHL